MNYMLASSWFGQLTLTGLEAALGEWQSSSPESSPRTAAELSAAEN